MPPPRPPTSVMNWRLFKGSNCTRFPAVNQDSRISNYGALVRSPAGQHECPLWVIRVGHDREDTAGYVRFAPKADKRADVSLSPLCAMKRREQVQQ